MHHSLSTLLTTIDDDPISIIGETLLFCQLGGYVMDMANQGPIIFLDAVDVWDVLARDDQQMHRSLGVDVFKGYHLLIGINYIR